MQTCKRNRLPLLTEVSGAAEGRTTSAGTPPAEVLSGAAGLAVDDGAPSTNGAPADLNVAALPCPISQKDVTWRSQ